MILSQNVFFYTLLRDKKKNQGGVSLCRCYKERRTKIWKLLEDIKKKNKHHVIVKNLGLYVWGGFIFILLQGI